MPTTALTKTIHTFCLHAMLASHYCEMHHMKNNYFCLMSFLKSTKHAGFWWHFCTTPWNILWCPKLAVQSNRQYTTYKFLRNSVAQGSEAQMCTNNELILTCIYVEAPIALKNSVNITSVIHTSFHSISQENIYVIKTKWFWLFSNQEQHLFVVAITVHTQ
jgi:hypothetical protein